MKLDELQEAVEAIDRSEIQKFIDIVSQHEKIVIIGNGGSNAIASHISQDYTKQLKKKAFSYQLRNLNNFKKLRCQNIH